MKSIANLYNIYLFKFYVENRKTDETTNWRRWHALDKICYQLEQMH